MTEAQRFSRFAPFAPVIVWAAILLLIRPWGNFPVNDDWVYAQTVRHVLDGRFAFDAPSSANVFLQAYWGALFCAVFGFSYEALRWSSLVAATGAVLALHALIAEIGADRRVALVACLTLLLNPIFVVTAGSFMTDSSFICLTTLATWLFVRGTRREERLVVLSSYLLLFAALLVRQHALLFIIGFGVADVVRRRLSARSIIVLIATVAAGVVVQLLYQHWIVSTGRTPALPASSAEGLLPRLGLRTFAIVFVKSGLLMPYLGLMAAPMLLVSRFAGLRAWLRDYRIAVTVSMLALIGMQAALIIGFKLHMPYYGNVLNSYGVGPLTLRDTFVLGVNLPPEPMVWQVAWLVGTVIGIIASSAILIELGAVSIRLLGSVARRSPVGGGEDWLDALLVAIIILYLALTAFMTIGHNAFDRYLLPLVPILAVLLARHTIGTAKLRLAGSAILLAVFAVYTVLAAHDYFEVQRARLAASNALDRAGIAPERIDAGYEFTGPRLRSVPKPQPGLSYWAAGNDYVVAMGPLRGYEPIRSYPYPRWLDGRMGRVVILHRSAGPIDLETSPGLVMLKPPPGSVPCPLWLAGRPTCPRRPAS